MFRPSKGAIPRIQRTQEAQDSPTQEVSISNIGRMNMNSLEIVGMIFVAIIALMFCISEVGKGRMNHEKYS